MCVITEFIYQHFIAIVVLLLVVVITQPFEEIAHARAALKHLRDKQEDAVHNSSVCHRLAAEVQPENMFNSSAVKLCLRR